MPHELLSDITREEHTRRERARVYERALHQVTECRRGITVLEPQIEQYAKQVKLLTKIEDLVTEMNGEIQGKGGFLARYAMLDHVQVARADQERRLRQVQDTLTRAKAMLVAAEADLAALD